jgi:hypothetical protein
VFRNSLIRVAARVMHLQPRSDEYFRSSGNRLIGYLRFEVCLEDLLMRRQRYWKGPLKNNLPCASVGRSCEDCETLIAEVLDGIVGANEGDEV